ncbi:MAG: cobyric acid synthase [Nitrospirae bacterium]|nr:MAG: cobyric acid synthase [Nitrospirota bacterium]
MACALAVLGTGSDVGKSLIAAGLCRILARRGKRVAPFKAQNMALNSFVTIEGGEIGRAQALQAQACGLLPHVDMNPILLKPETDQRVQVIVQGKVWDRHDACSYGDARDTLWPVVQASYTRLSRQAEVMVIEGAGSAAEVNLKHRDLVNWPVVRLADAAVLLVADIDRGGVFAQVLGTLDLLEPDERRRVIGLIINKFRGDPRLFAEGVAFLERRSGVPVLGVIPFLRDLALDQEDSVSMECRRTTAFSAGTVNIAVILLPHMSNFTDFNTLAAEPDVAFGYVRHPADLAQADVIMIPGSKTTLDDLAYLRDTGFAELLLKLAAQGREIVGLCGGFQMLGRWLADPDGVERQGREKGLGLLDIETMFKEPKTARQVVAQPLFPWSKPECPVEGYEIHMGVTRRGADAPCFRVFQVRQARHAQRMTHHDWSEETDGARSPNELVWGTYIHGVFDQPIFRRLWLNQVRQRKGLPPLGEIVSRQVQSHLQSALDRWADHLERHLNLAPVWQTVTCGMESA